MNAHNPGSALTPRATDSLAISLRAFVTDPQAKPRRPSNWKPPRPSQWTSRLRHGDDDGPLATASLWQLSAPKGRGSQ